jgi:hypothetical protein
VTARRSRLRPAGAVAVDPAVPGDLAAKTRANPAPARRSGSPGTHTLGDDKYGQVSPEGRRRLPRRAGRGPRRPEDQPVRVHRPRANVKITYLTVRGFAAPRDEGVVNHDSGDGWVIEHTTIQDNDGAGLMAGARQQVRGNCLRDNGQYGMNAYKAGTRSPTLVVEGNEITGNNTGDWETKVRAAAAPAASSSGR